MRNIGEARSVRGLHVLVSSQVPTEKIQKIISAKPAVIQLREKIEPDEKMIWWSRQVIEQMPKRADGSTHSLVVVNDKLAVANVLKADGLHVGQNDLAVSNARRGFPHPKLLGLSVSNIRELEEALEEDVDYLGVGPIFDSSSKSDAQPPMGIKGFRKIRERAGNKLLVAIGGIDLLSLREVMDAGADGIAGISFVVDAEDPAEVVEKSEEIIFTYSKVV